MDLDLPVPARALAIGAHPDDVEFGCGATLAKWAAGGAEIFHLVCTDGSKGSWDPAQDVAELVATRQDEQRAASRALGGRGEVTFLSWPDGELESGIPARREVARAIRTIRPDVVLGHDPWKRYRLHPDHRHAGFLAVEGIVAARDPHFFPDEGLAHHRPTALLLFEADEINHVEAVSTTDAEHKVAALMEHHSQLRSTMHIEDMARADQVKRFVDRVQARLTEHGQLGGVALGEAFHVMADL